MNGGGPLESSVTLEDVFVVVSARRVPLAPELAGYLVLEVTDHADPNGGDVDPRSVFVGEEGTVALVKPRREGATGDAEASIRAALARLLDASGSQTPALAAASRRKNGAGLSALAEELEAALIPVNRAAGRRALARLAREVKRVTLGVGRNALPSSSDATPSSRRLPSGAGDPGAPSTSRSAVRTFAGEEEPTTARGKIPPELIKKSAANPAGEDGIELPTTQFERTLRRPTASDVDVDSLIDRFSVSEAGVQQHARELKAIAGIDATPAAPAAAVANDADDPTGGAEDVDELLDAHARQKSITDERQLPTQPSLRKRPSTATLSSVARLRGPGVGLILAAALLLGAGGYAVWRLGPSIVGAHPAERAAPSAPALAPPKRAVCKRTLTVTDVPPHAEVLLREGQAPVEVPHLPVGAHLEFVATAEGYAPKRLVVPESAPWENSPDGVPRLETAVQLDKSKIKAGAADLWPAPDPGSVGKGTGQPGTVRVVATPRGAEVWMLVGESPEAQVVEDSCDEDVEVLIAGPTTFRKRLHVTAADFASTDPPGAPPPRTPSRAARISAKPVM